MTSSGRVQQSNDLTITTAGGLVGRRASGETVGISRGPRKQRVDYGLYSARPDAKSKRLKYATDEAYRAKVLNRTRDWRSEAKKCPIWRIYDLARNRAVRCRRVIDRMEARVKLQREKLVTLCLEAEKLKRKWQRQKSRNAA